MSLLSYKKKVDERLGVKTPTWYGLRDRAVVEIVRAAIDKKKYRGIRLSHRDLLDSCFDVSQVTLPEGNIDGVPYNSGLWTPCYVIPLVVADIPPGEYELVE